MTSRIKRIRPWLKNTMATRRKMNKTMVERLYGIKVRIN
ncbi:hypothetical protein Goshw_005968, partial [Gossypium schwendimanii]|nr:hypothetical protein [Gossypium schwendimanii]